MPNTKSNITDNNWWRGAVMYQIYPRSYKDTSGNGVGDLRGITEKLDYIASLGVDGIWISPFFKSPMKDFGYDVANYRMIDPLFGTLGDFQELLDEAHKRNLKIVIDMVLSHTSNHHEWFRQSQQNRTNFRADWYVWEDPKPDGSPPNNWMSVFGGPAWTFDAFRGQYYLHNFLKEQPDLNYHNPAVVEAMLEECRFWLDIGVDGFRLDAINFCTHDAELRDNPPREDGGSATQLEFPDTYSMQSHIYSKSRPENLDFMRKIRALTDEYDAKFIVAEIGDDDEVKRSQEYTAGPDLLHTAYSFAFMINQGAMPDATLFHEKILEQMGTDGKCWPSWAFSNHDVIRAASRWSGTEYDHKPELSQMLISLVSSLRGTAFLYQGEELGLPEAEIPYLRIQDPWGKYLYPKWQGRDGCRTPMPWVNEGEHAGFSDVEETWLPVPETHLPLAVAEQEKDPASTLNYTREFIAWRKQHSAMKEGSMTFILDVSHHILAFTRKDEHEEILCLFNTSEKLRKIPNKHIEHEELRNISFHHGDVKVTEKGIEMAPYACAYLTK